MPIAHGRLHHPDTAPATGEHTHRLAALDHAVIDQILSGRLDRAVDYCQDEDEWVVVLHGRAALDLGEEHLRLGPGDWALLPARVPHRLVETEPGTSWLTVTSVTRSDGP